MNKVYFSFYAELKHFLSPPRQELSFAHQFNGRVSIKDMIESFGVPHTEVDQIIVNGNVVDFSYIVQHGDQCNIYPVSVDQKIGHNQQQQLPGFVLDVHLGKLANHLRMLGFDTLYRNDYADEELAYISSNEERILLTRDLGVLKRSIVKLGYYVRETNPQRQLVEVLQRFDLFDQIRPFFRCIQCNISLKTVAKETIIEKLPPKVREHYQEFRQCPSCEQIFWKGSHFHKMQEFVVEIMKHRAIAKE